MNPSMPRVTSIASAASLASGACTFEQLRAAHLPGRPKPDVETFFALYAQLSAPFQALLDAVFAQPGLWSAFARGPSSRAGHHSGVGGNLRHTLEVARLSLVLGSDATCADQVDRDVQIAAALLHDVGKAQEYEETRYGWRMSAQGRLVGHKFVGFAMVWSALQKTAGITEHQREALLNCLSSSSQGARSSSTRGAAATEAKLLHKADGLSAESDLTRASYAACGQAPGFGVRHPHQRETPYHVKPGPQHAPQPAQPAQPVQPALRAQPGPAAPVVRVVPATPATPAAPSVPAAAPGALRPSLLERLRAASRRR